jgi:hypothetical protein
MDRGKQLMINYDELFVSMKEISDPRQSTYNFLNKHYKDGVYCELGVWYSDNIKGFLANCTPSKLYAVDVFEDVNIITVTNCATHDQYSEMYKIIKELESTNSNLEIIKDFTTNASKLVEDNSLDFIYIDSDHSYEGVVEDLLNWVTKVKKGGIISGHDHFEYTSGYAFGVVKAVAEFREKYNVKYFHVTPEGFAPSWYIIKDWE